MRRRRSRLARRIRVVLKRAARRLDRNTPEWARWFTPWLSSLSAHGVALLALALIVAADSTVRGRGAIDATLAVEGPVDLTTIPSAGDDQDGMEVKLAPSPDDRLRPEGNSIDAKMSLESGFGLIVAPTEDIVGKGPATGPPVYSLARPSELASPFLNRRPDTRARTARREGGTTESEQAVARGLDWLRRHQKPDGRWSFRMAQAGKKEAEDSVTECEVAATALALLPMLGAGNTHREDGVYRRRSTRV